MEDYSEHFAALADSEMWVDGATVLAGLIAPSLVEKGIESVQQVPDLPAEGYGVAAILLAEFVPMGDYMRHVQVGAGSNVLINGVGRFTEGSSVDQYIPEV